MHESELAALATQVWAECLQESPAEDGDGKGEGGSKLLEQGVVTYTVKNLNGCLSAKKSPKWQQRKSRGVEVPRGRLPTGLEL